MTTLDVVAVGHAIVDRISFVDDALVVAAGIAKGSMRLVDTPQDLVLDGVGVPRLQWAAGSAANTAAGLALLGSSIAFVGRVGEDALGAAYAADLAGLGVELHPAGALPGGVTGQCLVLVTPDGERTMATHLGASTALAPADLPGELVGRARILYAEGYLWDSPGAVGAVGAALGPSSGAGARGDAGGARRPIFALSLSDPLCVERHRDAFRAMVASQVGLLFANEAEILALTGLADLEAVVAEVRGWGCVVAITRGAGGSIAIRGDEVEVAEAVPVSAVVDTTGAGDLYAAGFLHAYLRGAGLGDCARLGSVAAAEVIGHVGARPVTSLRSLASAAGLGAHVAPDLGATDFFDQSPDDAPA